MDFSFNMDFILGNPIPRSIGTCLSNDGREHNWIYENISMDDKEERMLPDSSLSPSNQTFLSYMMDENKLSDTESIKLSAEKSKLNTNVSIYNKHCRLVIDSKGDEYLVAETHLVPIVEACKDLFEHPPSSPSKDCVITTTSNPILDLPMVDSKLSSVHIPGVDHPGLDDSDCNNNSDAPILESFLYASQLALVEVKLRDVERELINLDRCAFSQFVNSANNLKTMSGHSFISQVYDHSTSTAVGGSGDGCDVDADMDDGRRIRLRRMVAKHSELKRWLTKLKKQIREKPVSKLGHIVDYSSFDRGQLPLPDYLDDSTRTRSIGQCSLDRHEIESGVDEDIDIVETVKEHSHTRCLSSEIIGDVGLHQEDGNACIMEDMVIGSRASSKAGSDPEGIPNLSYEYESGRDSDLQSKGDKSSSGDQVASTDSECPNHQSPPTPDLRRAELDSNDISEGIRVLVVQKDYLRAGVIHVTSNGDTDQKLWKVTIDGDRKCQDIVISEWQLLEQGVREVIPTSASQLAPGSRVCANWSVQLPLNLYPGSISLSSAEHSPSLHRLAIDFDDGDHKDVDLDQVRLLPENFPNLHELMKASHFLDSSFYSLDRKNRLGKKRINRLLGTKESTKSLKAVKKRCINDKVKRRPIKGGDGKTKKLVVQWRLVKKSDSYELVRNVDNLCLRGGDSVQLLSYSRHNYMANVVSVLARRQGPIMEIEFNWYYILSDVQDNSEIIRRLKRSAISKKIIFKTSHSDVNDVYSVLRKVEVLSFADYRTKYMRTKSARREVPSDSYVMAGSYDQSRTRVESLDENIRHYILSGGH